MLNWRHIGRFVWPRQAVRALHVVVSDIRRQHGLGVRVRCRSGTRNFHQCDEKIEQPLDAKFGRSSHYFRPLVVLDAHTDHDTATTVPILLLGVAVDLLRQKCVRALTWAVKSRDMSPTEYIHLRLSCVAGCETDPSVLQPLA